MVVNLLVWIRDKYMSEDFVDHTVAPSVRAFLRCIGSESPVSSYLPPTFRCSMLIDKVVDKCIRHCPDSMEQLHRELPIFFNLLNDLQDDLPDAFRAIVLHLKIVSRKPFERPVPHKMPTASNSDVLCW